MQPTATWHRAFCVMAEIGAKACFRNGSWSDLYQGTASAVPPRGQLGRALAPVSISLQGLKPAGLTGPFGTTKSRALIQGKSIWLLKIPVVGDPKLETRNCRWTLEKMRKDV